MKFKNLSVDIEKLQEVQLELLLEFDRICRKHKINYQLFGGTLLGAIRHKGFIPWDDDLDVSLLRKDYNRFIRVCQKELDPKYFLQSPQTDKNYILPYAKLRKNNTLYLEDVFAEEDIHNGIFIDIFPLDNVNPDTFLTRIQTRIKLLYLIIHFFRIRKYIDIHMILSKRNIILRILSLYFHYLFKFIPKKLTKWLHLKLVTWFNNKDTDFVTPPHLNKYLKKKWMTDSIEGTFEGNSFLIPRKYDEILSNLYGNYMKFPPKEERTPQHPIIKVSFTNS